VYAELGEDALDNLATARNWLHLKIIAEVERNRGTDCLFEWVGQMEHEVDVINEIIKKGRIILRLEGRDKTSLMLRHRREAGISIPNENEIWGSV